MAPSVSRGALAPLREREFRLLFCAQAVSLLGSWMTPLALAFAVLDLTGSASDLGIVLGAELAPLVVLLAVGGVWADRLPRVRLMIASDLVSAVGQGVLAALLIGGVARIWEMAALAAVAGGADAFHTPAWAGLLPQTVPAPLRRRANALRLLESNVLRVAGPVLAGLIVATAGAGWAIAADSASFLLAAAVLARMRTGREPARGEATERSGFVADLAAGGGEVWRRPWLLAMIIDTALWTLVIWGPYEVLGPYVSKHRLGGAGAWALISAAYGLGTVVGGLAALHVRSRRPLIAAVSVNAAFAPLLVLLAVSGQAWWIALAAFPAGASTSLYLVLWNTALQQAVPEHLMGRVASLDQAAFNATAPVGMVLAGPTAAALGVRDALLISAAWLLVSTAFVLSVPGVRRFRAAEE